jgi:hypothetical protein
MRPRAGRTWRLTGCVASRLGCTDTINTILITLADIFLSPDRTTRHVSVANACLDDIWRKLRQLFAYVMVSKLISLRSCRHYPCCLRLAHPGHLHAIPTSVNFQGSFDPASSRLQAQYLLHLPLYVTSFQLFAATEDSHSHQGSFSLESSMLPPTEQL